MDGFDARKSGSGRFNKNEPFGNNPFISIPADVDRAPFRLVWIDILSVFSLSKLLLLIINPLWPCISGPLDELSPTWSNLKDVFLQGVLIISQVLLFVTLPIVAVLYWFLPGVIHLLYLTAFAVVTLIVTRLLNGGPRAESLVGLPDSLKPVNDEHELWFFINGIATGRNWLQSNLSLLAQTFQREIVGIHNPTKGLFFDLIECLIQRDLDYKTRDIRQGRAQIRSALASAATKKVVLILHSQGGIEGSSILDWLLSDLSHEVISKLEIFTFGNAARRFNNPLLAKHNSSVDEDKGGRGERVIKHIEHYANSEDFVANIGVLNFTSPSAQPYADGNAFSGLVFIREGSGHLLNMHYLDKMFPMVNGRVDDVGNTFMNTTIGKSEREGVVLNGHGPRMIKDVSRLWQYRNGGKPQD